MSLPKWEKASCQQWAWRSLESTSVPSMSKRMAARRTRRAKARIVHANYLYNCTDGRDRHRHLGDRGSDHECTGEGLADPLDARRVARRAFVSSLGDRKRILSDAPSRTN